MKWLCRFVGHKIDPDILDCYGVYECMLCRKQSEEPLREKYTRLASAACRIRDWFTSAKRWIKKCPQCDRRFGRHDYAIDHLPF